jgi:hypothetical protein
MSVCVSPHISPRQRLGRHVPMATNTCNNIRRRRFLYGSCRIKREPVGLSVYPAIVARQWLGKHVLAAKKNCWRRRILCDQRKVGDYFFLELLVIL